MKRCGNKKTCDDCFKCKSYYSSHSAHYDSLYKKEVIEISCSIGRNMVFDAITREQLN